MKLGSTVTASVDTGPATSPTRVPVAMKFVITVARIVTKNAPPNAGSLHRDGKNRVEFIVFLKSLIFSFWVCNNYLTTFRYHVPRSFLQDGDNKLVLFEEFGGNPLAVNFKTVSAGTVCGNAYEGNTLELSCQGRPISAVKFANFGEPAGSCGAFHKGTCESKTDALPILQKECVGKETCSIDVSEENFGGSDCGNSIKRLAVEVVC